MLLRTISSNKTTYLWKWLRTSCLEFALFESTPTNKKTLSLVRDRGLLHQLRKFAGGVTVIMISHIPCLGLGQERRILLNHRDNGLIIDGLQLRDGGKLGQVVIGQTPGRGGASLKIIGLDPVQRLDSIFFAKTYSCNSCKHFQILSQIRALDI